MRYILLDIQLSNAEGSYRKYQDEDPNIRQALTLWDQGVRVVNIYQFDRTKFSQDGWQVVYGGTDKIVSGSDIVLTEDIGATRNDEARTRYILADAQLGGVIDYYRQYTNEAPVKKAVELWDQGVRVVNIGNFERIIVANAGWQVVYRGSSRTINGMDVVLTTDNVSAQSMGSCDNNRGENRILYILADIQLSGSRDYYAEYADSDPYAAEAVHRWDSGVRVQNISAFERKIVGEKGWQIVYAGTDTTICGNDVVTETLPSTLKICHKYWYPAVKGAAWEYSQSTSWSASEDTFVKSITGVRQSGSETIMEVLSTWFGNTRPAYYRCGPNGVFDDESNTKVLPAESELYDGNSWQENGETVSITFETVTVPAGTFQALKICRLAAMEGCEYYVEGIGLVMWENPDALGKLQSYKIP